MSRSRVPFTRSGRLLAAALGASIAASMALGIGPVQAAEVVALGASQTYGMGLSSGEDYPSQLEKLLHEKGLSVSVKNAGVGGNTSEQILDRLDGVLDADTKVVILEVFHYNDNRHGVSMEDTKAHIAEMLAKLKSHHVKTILVTGADRWLFDLPRQSDGIHLTAEGQRTVAGRVLPQVVQALRH
jgi:acyl-CoA thioesterase I